MDSFTQIALGAAVGEAVLGKKVGNRAMVWGAIGGTIPDLDVIANLFISEVEAIAFHRGISHSILFACTFPLLAGWLINKLYSSGLYKHKGFKWLVFTIALSFYTLIAAVISAIPVIMGGEIYLPTILFFLLLGIAIAHLIRKRFVEMPSTEVNTSWKDWAWLMFWAILTHPLLDCCTAYGTQVFQPFSDYRVAFNTISVVDPIYTLPLIIGLLLAARLTRNSPKRTLLNYFGLGLSTAYLIFTVWNKTRINRIFENTLAQRELSYQRYMTSPTIFSNVLWNCLAEDEKHYYYGKYSIFDRQKEIKHLLTIPKNHELTAKYEGDRTFEILKWFSNDYYNISHNENGKLQFNDLRYGVMDTVIRADTDYIFRFELEEEEGKLKAAQTRESEASVSETFDKLWTRIKGI